MRCAWCGSENAPDGSFCVKCGKPLPWGGAAGRCPGCGADNAAGMKTCGSCGAPLAEVRQAPPPPPAASEMSRCKWCGKPVPPGSTMCWECAEGPSENYVEFTDSQVHSESPSAAAALLIIAGVLTMIQGFVLMAGVSILDSGSGLATCCGPIDILFGLGAIAGGIMASKRENYTLVLVGCILAIVGFGAAIGTVLGIIALIMVLAHKEEFY